MAIVQGSRTTAGGTAGMIAHSSGFAERRKFDVGDRIAELTPSETPFLTFLTKLSKEKTADPDFKHFEHRSGWLDKKFLVNAGTPSTWSSLSVGATITNLVVDDGSGNNTYTSFVKGMIVTLMAPARTAWTNRAVALVTNVDSGGIDLKALTAPSAVDNIVNNDEIYVIGTAHEEGGLKAETYSDEPVVRYGSIQEFKTGYKMSDILKNTDLWGGNEWNRIRADKMKEHKFDIERALIFGKMVRSSDAVTSVWAHNTVDLDGDGTSGTVRTTDGIYQFVKSFGTTQSANAWGNRFACTYTSYTWSDFVDDMEQVFQYGSDQRVCLCGSTVFGSFSKFGSNTFLGSSPQINVNQGDSKFGLKIITITTPFGELNLVHDKILRGRFADLMLSVDMNNIRYRFMQNLDTLIETGIQTPGETAEHEEIRTVAGLQVDLLETHSIFEFVTSS